MANKNAGTAEEKKTKDAQRAANKSADWIKVYFGGRRPE